MNILKYSISLAILLKCVIASEGGVRGDVIKALGEPGFVSIKRDWWSKWQDCDELFNCVAMDTVEFTIDFINQVEHAKGPTLAALFIHGHDKVDEVLEKIGYEDEDLMYLTDDRLEVAED